MIRDLTGQTFAKLLIGTLRAAFSPKTEGQGDQREIARSALLRYGIFLSVFLIVTSAIGAPWLMLLWVAAFATWFQLFLRLRNIAEHACTDTNDDPYTHARTTYGKWWERPFVAPYWVNYHAEHHLCPMVPFHALGKMHEDVKGKMHPVGESYPKVHGEILDKISKKQGVTWDTAPTA